MDPSVLGELVRVWRQRAITDSAHTRVYRTLAEDLLRASGVCEHCLGAPRDADSVCSGCSGTGWAPPSDTPGAARPLLHNAFADTPLAPGYAYSSTGLGVREDAVQAVLDAWARVSPTGDPAGPLAYVNQGEINHVENLARLAASAALRAG